MQLVDLRYEMWDMRCSIKICRFLFTAYCLPFAPDSWLLASFLSIIHAEKINESEVYRS
jgi:hypothetical protein